MLTEVMTLWKQTCVSLLCGLLNIRSSSLSPPCLRIARFQSLVGGSRSWAACLRGGPETCVQLLQQPSDRARPEERAEGHRICTQQNVLNFEFERIVWEIYPQNNEDVH